MDKFKIICGIEIETAFDGEEMPISTGGYHESRFNRLFGKYFNVESDGSLHGNYPKYRDTAEFVSRPFILKDWAKVISDFKLATESNGNVPTLKEIYDFNSSCGAHIHFTLLGGSDKYYEFEYKHIKHKIKGVQIPIKKLNSLAFFKSIRQYTFKQVKEQMGKEFFEKWKKRYWRRYAKHISTRSRNARYLEFNSTCGGQQIEWRSFHLLGVDTWEKFYTMYEIAFNAIKYAVMSEIVKAKPFLKEEKSKFEFDIAKDAKSEKDIYIDDNEKKLEVIVDVPATSLIHER